MAPLRAQIALVLVRRLIEIHRSAEDTELLAPILAGAASISAPRTRATKELNAYRTELERDEGDGYAPHTSVVSEGSFDYAPAWVASSVAR